MGNDDHQNTEAGQGSGTVFSSPGENQNQNLPAQQPDQAGVAAEPAKLANSINPTAANPTSFVPETSETPPAGNLNLSQHQNLIEQDSGQVFQQAQAANQNTTQPGSNQNTSQPSPIGQISNQTIPNTGQSGANKPSFKKILIPLGVLVVLGIIGTIAFVVIQRSGLNTLFGQKGEIVWWGVQFEESEVAPLIDEYEKQNPGINITYIKQSTQDYRDRLANSLAGGKGPDIFEMHNSWPKTFDKDLAALPSGIMSQAEYAKTFYPIVVNDATLQKGIVAMPLEYDALTLFVNQDIFSAAAKSPPKSWNELRDLAIELTQRSGDKIIVQGGVALGTTDNVDHWPEIVALMLLQNKADPAKPSGKLAEDALVFYTLFNSADKVWDNTMPQSTIAFANNKVAMYIAPSWRAAEIIKINPNSRFRTVALPQLPKDKPTDPDVTYATYWLQGVWTKSASKDEAWKFLKYLTTTDVLQKLNSNIKSARGIQKMSPRVDAGVFLAEDPILGSVAALAPSAKSWFMAQNTYDGANGVNSRINAVYKTALADIVKATGRTMEVEKVFAKANEELAKVFAQYSLLAN